MTHRRDTLAAMKAHRHLRLVWPPPPKHYSRPGRSIAEMGMAFQSAGSRIAGPEVSRLADAIDRHFS